MSILVEAQTRDEKGKNACRRLRAQGMIPAVLYGPQIDSVPISVDPREVMSILHSESGRNTIFKVSVGESTRDVMIRDYQIDPIRDRLLHTDFQAIAMDQMMTFEVPIEVIGKAQGVKDGGVLEVILREITVECLPADVPGHIRVDVTQLEVNDTLHVSELEVDREKIEIQNDPEVVVLLVAPPTIVAEAAEEEEIAEEGEEAAEPEVIGKGKEEQEGEED